MGAMFDCRRATASDLLVGGLESLEPWNFMTFHILGMSSSQLTNTIIFQRGSRGSNHQPVRTVRIGFTFHFFSG